MVHRVRNVKMCNRTKFCGNRSKHDRHLPIFSNFKMAAVHHPGFLKIKNFNGQQGYASSCKISWQSVIRW